MNGESVFAHTGHSNSSMPPVPVVCTVFRLDSIHKSEVALLSLDSSVNPFSFENFFDPDFLTAVLVLIDHVKAFN